MTSSRIFVQDQGGMTYVTEILSMTARAKRGQHDLYRGFLATHRVASEKWREVQDLLATYQMISMNDLFEYDVSNHEERNKMWAAKSYSSNLPHWITTFRYQKGTKCEIQPGPSVKYAAVGHHAEVWLREQTQHNWRYVYDEERQKVMRNGTIRRELEDLFMWRILTDDLGIGQED